jgi:hypothetical protein
MKAKTSARACSLVAQMVVISVSRVVNQLFATALPKHDPTRPIQARRSRSFRTSRNSLEVCWPPQSEWKIAPPASWPVGRWTSQAGHCLRGLLTSVGCPSGGGNFSHALRVHWPACKAHGLCAQMLPEVVGLDQWGYPVVHEPVTHDLLAWQRARSRPPRPGPEAGRPAQASLTAGPGRHCPELNMSLYHVVYR